jgi:hypothetical protein
LNIGDFNFAPGMSGRWKGSGHFEPEAVGIKREQAGLDSGSITEL